MSDQDNNHNGNGHKPPKKTPVPTRKEVAIEKAAREYVRNGGSRTKAYIAAGYSPNGASENQGRLTRDDRFTAAVKREMAKAAACAGVEAADVLGQLSRLAFYDPAEFCDKEGRFDYKKAKRKGLTHLIDQIEVTERHAKDGSRRVTTKYHLARKQPALEALMKAIGMEKEPAKNPKDTARQVLKQIQERYPNLPAGEAERIVERQFGIKADPITDVGDKGLVA